MSLINDMLQDLEKRRGDLQHRAAVPRHVRVLPPVRKKSTVRRTVNAAAAVVCAATVAWYAYEKAPYYLQPAAKVAAAAATPATLRLAEPPQLERSDPMRVAANTFPPAIPTGSVVLPEPTSAPPAIAEKTVGSEADARALPRSGQVDAASLQREQAVSVLPMTFSLKMDVLPAERGMPSSSAATNKERSVPSSPASATNAASPQIDRKFRELTAPQLAENEYRTGANLLNQGRVAEAQERFSAALQQVPGHIGARQALFGLLLQAKRTAEAEQVLQDALKLDAAQPGFAMAMARIQVDRGDTPAAVETLQNAVHVSHANPDYLAFLAALLQRQGRHAQAVEHYQSALSLAPRSGIWLMGLGISLQALGRNNEARDAFRRARVADGLTGELQAFVDQRLKQVQ
ncbi:MAG: tetratricopeptide repeat protein [Burkholderiales bacterium]